MLNRLVEKLDWLDTELAGIDRQIDERMRDYADLIRRLDTIPGVDVVVAQAVIAETGTDMSQFSDAAHLASWAGLCPGNAESAGKRFSGSTRKGDRYLRRILVQSAWAAAHTNGSFLQSLFFRIARRRGEKKACVAVVHRIATIIWNIIRNGGIYEEAGADFFDRIRPERTARKLTRRLERIGFEVTVRRRPIDLTPDSQSYLPKYPKNLGISDLKLGFSKELCARVKWTIMMRPLARLLMAFNVTCVVRGADSDPATLEGTVRLELCSEIEIEPEPFKEPHFASERWFTLSNGQLITERTSRGVIRHPLPQSTYDAFARVRPERVRDDYRRPGTTIQKIGPWRVEGERLWFGKSVYDGEGHTGVGGFRYFDAVKKNYRIWSDPEVTAWSVSAILVEPETVWLGLAWNAEYGAASNGVIAFNRRTEHILKFDLPDIVQSIAWVSGHLLIATQFGPAVIDDGRVRRFFVDKTSDCRVYVVEATTDAGSAQ